MYDWWCNSIYGSYGLNAKRFLSFNQPELASQPKKKDDELLIWYSDATLCVCVTVINKFDTHCLLNTVRTRLFVRSFFIRISERTHSVLICLSPPGNTCDHLVRVWQRERAHSKCLVHVPFFHSLFGVLKMSYAQNKCNATQIIILLSCVSSYAQFIDSVWCVRSFFDYHAQA